MKMLGIDSSAKTVSVAVCDGFEIIASGFINANITHSETMLPLTESVLSAAKLGFSDIDAYAVTVGPGSFTGVRIAVSAVKGMAAASEKPVYAVSALEALAYNLMDFNCIAVPAMDARRNQVYNALFRIADGKITRLTDDRAISADDLSAELLSYENERIIILGDGAYLINRPELTASTPLRFPNAVSVCFAALSKEPVSAAALMPVYLRLPQAERERIKKEKANED